MRVPYLFGFTLSLWVVLQFISGKIFPALLPCLCQGPEGRNRPQGPWPASLGPLTHTLRPEAWFQLSPGPSVPKQAIGTSLSRPVRGLPVRPAPCWPECWPTGWRPCLSSARPCPRKPTWQSLGWSQRPCLGWGPGPASCSAALSSWLPSCREQSALAVPWLLSLSGVVESPSVEMVKTQPHMVLSTRLQLTLLWAEGSGETVSRRLSQPQLLCDSVSANVKAWLS